MSNTKKRPRFDNPDADSVPSEHVEQREFVSWFRKTFPGVRIAAIPNGGRRSKSEAMRLKAEGVDPGIPDLVVPEWLWWCEMKRQKGGTVSKEQKKWHEYLKWCGYQVSVCRGCDEAISEAKRLYKHRQL